MLNLTNGTVLTPFRTLDHAAVLCCDSKIVSVGASARPPACEEVDLAGLYVVPGFVDVHVHGGDSCEFWTEDPEEILKGAGSLARHGTTSLLPTVNYGTQMELDAPTRARLDAMREAMRTGRGAELLGLHLEGPHVSPRFPMISGQTLNPALPERYTAFLNYAPKVLKWTVAPEIAGVPELIGLLLARGVRVSLGHSDADLRDIYPAYEQGVRDVTHIYSGMSTLRRERGRRLPGLLEAALFLDEMDVELIANGAHLPPELIRLVWSFKGPEHILAVSDGTAATGSPDGPVLYRGQPGTVEDGAILRADQSGFLGSAVTGEEMLRNLVHRAGLPLSDAVRMCSTTPARSLGLGRRKGVIAPGYDADLLAFDHDLQLRLVVLRGKIFYQA